MDKNTLQQLYDVGQSVWQDNIRRGEITSGTLAKTRDEGVMGVTANPTIFEKAISGSTDYDTAIEQLVNEGKSAADIYKLLIIEDISTAADVFRPVYDKTHGGDGYISIEVAPGLAHDTEGTIAEALDFWELIKRPNIMVKVPATAAGIPAIEELLYQGLNINITLIFSVDAYRDVMEAYIHAFERRVEEGKPVDKIASVASFFVSRVDTKADKMLEDLLKAEKDPERQKLIKSLMGTTAINNSKIAYEAFQQTFSGERWERLAEQGAKKQRPLWASTSTKNPDYRDVIYVEELIGPDTVNTMPPATIVAFKDHGVVKRTIDEDLEGAKKQLAQLEEVGISLKQITDELTMEGVESFTKSFTTLDECLSTKRDTILSGLSERYAASLGGLLPQVSNGLRLATKNQIAQKIWSKDPSVWTDDTQAQATIKSRLGWLRVYDLMQERVDDLKRFAREVRDDGFTSFVLLGMGGSSLAPEVINRVFGQKEGYPRFYMLDSTEPGTIEAIERRIDPAKTLFIVATKSGGTTETISFYRYFREKVNVIRGAKARENFVAITDPGPSLETLAGEEGFRRVFLNMPDIGGRYSALSYFGIVPAALMGVDVEDLLDRAETMAEACAPCVDSSDNPGVWLGTLLGTLYKEGHDKITILTSPALDSFGLWAEQLIAESTGKQGKGLMPIIGEPLGRPSAYGRDRVFIYIRLDGSDNQEQEHCLDKLEKAGHPVVRLRMKTKRDLGGEFFRWEMATAVAAHFIGIDPFDEPNVQESKSNTYQLLGIYKDTGRLPEGDPILTSNGIALYGDAEALSRAGSEGTLESALQAFFRTVQPGDYVSFLGYVPSIGEHEELIQDARLAVRDTLKVATTFGYGPRFLHSTGQLHKGGPNRGLYVKITCDPRHDLPIPGEGYTFGTLIRAQAVGDLQSLHQHGRPALRLHIRGDHAVGIEHIRAAIRAALGLLVV